MLKKILLVLFLASLTLCEGEAGLRGAVRQEAIKDLIGFLAPMIQKKLADISVPDMYFNVPAGPFNFKVGVLGLHFGVTSFQPESLVISFQEPDILNVVLGNIAANSNFRVSFEWLFIKAAENVELKIFNIKANANLQMGLWDYEGVKLPNLEIVKFDLELDYDFELKGSLIADFVNLLKPAIKGSITELLTNTLKDLVKQLLKESMHKSPKYIPVTPEGMAIDYSFLAMPRIENGFLLVNTRGGFVHTAIPDTLEPRYPFPTNLPEFSLEGKQIQAFVSSYTINTALYTLYRSNLLKFDFVPEIIPPSLPVELTTDWFEVMIPGITDVYGKEKQCEVGLSVYKEPVFNFEEKRIKVTMAGAFDIKVRTDEGLVSAMKIQSDADLEIEFHVVEEGYFTAFIHEMILKNTVIIESTIPTATAEVFEEELNSLIELLKPLLNAYVIKKIHIELPVVEGIMFTNSTITHTLNYVSVNLNLGYQNIRHGVTEPVLLKNLSSVKINCGEGNIVMESKLIEKGDGKFYYEYTCSDVSFYFMKQAKKMCMDSEFAKKYNEAMLYMHLFE